MTNYYVFYLIRTHIYSNKVVTYGTLCYIKPSKEVTLKCFLRFTCNELLKRQVDQRRRFKEFNRILIEKI